LQQTFANPDDSPPDPGPGPALAAAEEPAQARDWRRLLGEELHLVIGVVALIAIFTVLYPDTFATDSNVQNVARQAGILLAVAIGQAFALLVGGFDISVAANMGLSATVGALVMTDVGLEAGLVAGLATGTAMGVVNGLLIAWLALSPFVVTLGTLTFATGLANELSDGTSVVGLPDAFDAFGADDWGPIPATVGIAVIVLVAAWFVLTRTRVGLYIFSIGGSRETCLLAGIRVVRYEILAYAICGFLAAVAGLMVSSRVGVGQAGIGQGYELLSSATAVIGGVAIGGGVGRLTGVVLGVVLLSVLTTGLNIAGVSEFAQQMVTGAVLIVAVLIGQWRARDPRRLLRAIAGTRLASQAPK
jgi:ribose/xylose/arabinose/galactoside ABC-type transport system permease subunit